MTRPRLVLASASPARRRLLRAAGIEPEVLVSGVDEAAVHASEPALLCRTLARMKAEAVADRLQTHHDSAPFDWLVLGCDSILDFEGQAYGKPTDSEDAIARWKRMRGRVGLLRTGHCLIDTRSGQSVEDVATTGVRFAEISDEEIAAYVATGEPLAVAGAFTIDGLGGAFLDGVDGDPSNVVGLSLPLLRRMLATLGTPITTLWTTE